MSQEYRVFRGTKCHFLKELADWSAVSVADNALAASKDYTFTDDDRVFYPFEDSTKVFFPPPNSVIKYAYGKRGYYGFRVGNWVLVVRGTLVNAEPESLEKWLLPPGLFEKIACERWVDSLQYIRAEVQQQSRKAHMRMIPPQQERVVRLSQALREAIQMIEELKKEK